MSKSKKILAVSLAAALAAGCLAGCAGGSKDSGSGSIPTLTWYVPKQAPSDKDAVMAEINKLLEDKLGAHLEIQFIDSGAFNDKMTMQFASGKEMDLCFVSDWTNDFLTAVQKGALEELDDLIDQYAPGLRDAVPDYLFESTKVNGKTYSIVNQQVLFRQQALMFFDEYTKKYNFDPTTVKELKDAEPFLQQIKDNETSIYPYAWKSNQPLMTEYEKITPDSANVVIKIDSDDVKVEVKNETDTYRDAVKLMQEWYKKGYIRKDVNSLMNTEDDIAAGKYALAETTYKPGVEQEYKDKTGLDVTVIPLGEPEMMANAGIAAMTAIPKSSKHKDLAIKLLELVNTDKELYNLICFGIEGKHYNRIDENYIELIPDSGYSLGAAWMFGNQFNAYLTVGQDLDVWEKTEELNNSAIKSPISGFTLDTEPIKTELSQLSTVRTEYSSVDSGTEDDAKYEELIQKLNDAGQQTVKEEVQRQIDEYLKSK